MTLEESAWDFVCKSVWYSIRDHTYGAVCNSVYYSGRETVRNSVGEPIGESVWDVVYARITKKIKDQL
jgi:hypothetical protein